jgi:predicted 3-demethylubiquinone-9 3-methyltransferase (glyoxalase superfamily)
MLFVRDNAGKAEEAMKFYTSIFDDAKISDNLNRYPEGMEPDKGGTLMFGDFTIENQWVAAMDSAQGHEFNFNEAVSFMVNCKDQKEIDYFWEKLSAVPEAEQCGWVKDQYGVSWQILPAEMNELYSGDAEKSKRAMEAMLQMKKLDIAELKQAYEQG